jgi:hypothetical protein
VPNPRSWRRTVAIIFASSEKAVLAIPPRSSERDRPSGRGILAF